MSDNNIKTNAQTSADVSTESLKKSVTEYLAKAAGDKSPKNIGGAEKALELYQKVLSSNLPDEDKENMTLNLLGEWGKVVEDISETALSAQPELSIGYILSQIEKIQQDNEYIYKALETLSGIATGQGPADVAGEGKAKGIADTVKCRETTNQKLIAFYEKLYDDIKPPKQRSTKEMALDIISQAVNCNYGDSDPDQLANLAEAISSMLDGIRHIDH